MWIRLPRLRVGTETNAGDRWVFWVTLTLHDLGDNLRTNTELREPALDSVQSVGLHHRLDDRVSVHRADRSEVDHLARDAVLRLELFSRDEAVAHWLGV